MGLAPIAMTSTLITPISKYSHILRVGAVMGAIARVRDNVLYYSLLDSLCLVMSMEVHGGDWNFFPSGRLYLGYYSWGKVRNRIMVRDTPKVRGLPRPPS